MKRVLMIAVMLGMIGSARAQQPPAAPAPAVAPTSAVPAASVVDAAARMAAFNDLLAKAQISLDNVTLDDFIKLLTEARALGRPYAASGVARAYMTRHADPDRALLRLAAQNAMLTGEYRIAIGRYRQLLRNAPVDASSSEAAGELMEILVDDIGQGAEAFAANLEHGDKFRQAPKIRQYDGWFLDACWRDRATGPMAKRLATIFAEKMPLEQERYAYWHQLDRLIDRLASVYPGNVEAVIPARALVPLIREDAVRAARLKFLVENVAFHENRVGKNAQALAESFEPVLAAAKAYVDIAPTDASLRQIVMAFYGGPDRREDAIWNTLSQAKMEFFATYGFSKLPVAEQIKFLNVSWFAIPACLATPEQWIALGNKHPQAFQKAAGTAQLPWVTQATNDTVYKAQAQFLAGSAFDNAAVICAVASAGDVNGAIQNLLKQSSWYMPFIDRSRNPSVELFPDIAYNRILRVKTGLKAPANAGDAQLAFMEDVLFSSPMTPFLHESVRESLRSIWSYCNQDAARRDRFIALLGKLAWVPFVSESRDRVLEPAMVEFREWSKEMRRQFDGLAGKSDDVSVKRRAELEGIVSQIVKIEEAFAVSVQTQPDPAKAPNPLCRELATVLKAIRAGDASAYAASAKALYALVREYQKDKTPFGEALLEVLMTPRDNKLDCFRQQTEFLADQLALRLSDPSQTRGAQVCIRVMGTREGWRFDGWRLWPRNEDTAMRDRVAEVLGKALEVRTAKDQWDGELFAWFTGVARQESDPAKAVVSAIIDRDLFTKHNVRWGDFSSPVCGAMSLINSTYPSLRDKYPVESWFDDRMAAEIKRTGKIDEAYWTQLYGRDKSRKVANAVAEALTADLAYPFVGTPAVPAKYGRDQYMSLMRRALSADPALADAFLAKVEAAYGKTRFDDLAAGAQSLGRLPVDTPEQRKVFFGRLKEYAARARSMPYPITLPNLPQINTFQLDSKTQLSDEDLTALAECLRYTQWTGWAGTEDRLFQLLHDGLVARGRIGELVPLIPEMWRIAAGEKRRETMLMLTGLASRMLEGGDAFTAAAYCVIGLGIASPLMPDDIRNSVTALRTRTMAKVGSSLMVPRTDKRYPILSAQALFSVGMQESAWNEYQKAPALALTEFKDLDLGFTVWLVGRHTAEGEFDAAKALILTLLQWVDASPQGFDLETRAQMRIALGDIAMAQKDYAVAKEDYLRVSAAPDFVDSLGAARAEIKLAEIERQEEKYDLAFERLAKLDGHRDSSIQAEVRYQMAVLRFTQKDYDGAREALVRVFAVAPGHPEAVLLQGKVNLIKRNLIEVLDLKLGTLNDQQVLIPGRPLKVGLEDRTLAVVGKSVEIEIRAWTDSGDQVFFLLHQYGDSKTRFRGEVKTALAPIDKTDSVLQVLGRDKVHYSFSERFRKVAQVAIEDTVSVEVISDGDLEASSGRILSKEEKDARALDALVRQRLAEQQIAVPTVKGASAPAAAVPLSEIREYDKIKPGNPLYIRVNDPDRSVTHGKDVISVRAMATSGDVVSRFSLLETDTHSGVFEGKLPTVWAPATAFASDTEEGKDANFVISSNMKLNPWIGLADKNRHKLLTVDMHDNVALGKLTLTADTQGRALKRFAVQTSLNGRDYATVATWPEPMMSWDGALRLRAVRSTAAMARSGNPSAAGFAAAARQFNEYLDYGRLVEGSPVYVEPGKTAADLKPLMAALQTKLDLQSRDASANWVLAHIQGMFYVTERRTRTFKLDPKASTNGTSFILMVDGTPALVPDPLLTKSGAKRGAASAGKAKEKSADAAAVGTEAPPSLPEVKLSLRKGYHVLDLYICVPPKAEVAYELLWDTKEAKGKGAAGDATAAKAAAPAKTGKDPVDGVRIPEAALTAAGWPAGMPPPAVKPLEVKAQDKNTKFELAFLAGSNARLVRFGIFDFESDAPAVRKVALTDAEGKTVLPVAGDVLALRENQILEVVPGDRVTVSYDDPACINKNRQKQEVFLQATFYNGTLTPCLVETIVDPNDSSIIRSQYLPVKRYKPDSSLAVFVHDTDADVSEATNSVKAVARTSVGAKIEMTAEETGKNTATFLGKFSAVSKKSKDSLALPVDVSDDIELIYRDEENVDIGIPWNRVADLQAAVDWADSEMRVTYYEWTNEMVRVAAASNELVKVAVASNALGKVAASSAEEGATQERMMPIRRLVLVKPESAEPPEAPVNLVPGDPLEIEVLNSSLSYPPRAEAEVLVQVISTGGLAVVSNNEPFDPTRPGTIRYRIGRTGLSDFGDALFVFTIPTALGSIDDMDFTPLVPDSPDLDEAGRASRKHIVNLPLPCLNEKGDSVGIPREYKVPPLLLRPDYVIRVAFDPSTNVCNTNVVVALTNATTVAAATNATVAVASNVPPKWVVWNIQLASECLLDVMDQKYQDTVERINVGERLYLRVTDLMADLTMTKDTVTVQVVVNDAVQSAQPVALRETFENTGVFMGNVRLAFVGLTNETLTSDAIAVPYGATVTFRYTGRNGALVERQVLTQKGSDGTVIGLTRRFADEKMAVSTQFSTAEAYFALAKKLRDRKEFDQARQAIADARKVLDEAIREFPLTESRVQADYLLASLAFEMAEQTTDLEMRKRLLIEAAGRFGDVLSDFPDTEYAPKAQFRKAFTLERLGQFDAACEEYVKLSYRYPGHDLVAETINRLGQYFMTKGRDLDKEMKAEKDVAQKERLRIRMLEFYRTSAEVFGRLSARFPGHALAAKTKMQSGENWLRAQEPKKAIAVYESLIDDKRTPPELRSQSMYWCGDAYLRMGEPVGAYRVFKKLTWFYPETQWAKYARGRLMEKVLLEAGLKSEVDPDAKKGGR